MLSSLITSQTRVKLLRKFFLNSFTRAHLRGLEAEFGESTNAIRIELNRLENAGLLHSYRDGNKKIYGANTGHPLYCDIHNIIMKETGIDRVIDKVLHKLGKNVSIFLTGEFAKGMNGESIELILVGDDVDMEYLGRKIAQAEEMVGRRVTCVVIESRKAEAYLKELKPSELLPVWSNGL